MTELELKNLVAENSRQIAEIWALFRETDKQLKENAIQLRQTDNQIKENAIQLKQTDTKIDRLTGKWGTFIEAFLAPGIPKAFQEIGIPIHSTMQRLKKPEMEVDVLGLNDSCLVVVEVKSTLGKEDVDHFLKQLPKFRTAFPEFFQGKDRVVYGAVAGIEVHEQADRLAYQKGLFVLVQKGDTVTIANDEKFKAKTW